MMYKSGKVVEGWCSVGCSVVEQSEEPVSSGSCFLDSHLDLGSGEGVVIVVLVGQLVSSLVGWSVGLLVAKSGLVHT